MAYNYFNPQNAQPIMPQQMQNQMFPQPTGNVYAINSSNELSNIPVGVGLTVALCLPENMLYLKSIQNGNPVIWSYHLSTQQQNGEERQDTVVAQVPTQSNEDFNAKFQQVDKRLQKLEKIWEEKINEQF